MCWTEETVLWNPVLWKCNCDTIVLDHLYGMQQTGIRELTEISLRPRTSGLCMCTWTPCTLTSGLHVYTNTVRTHISTVHTHVSTVHAHINIVHLKHTSALLLEKKHRGNTVSSCEKSADYCVLFISTISGNLTPTLRNTIFLFILSESLSVCLAFCCILSSFFLYAGLLLCCLCVTVWYYSVVQAQRGWVLRLGSKPAERGPEWTKFPELV